MAPPLDDYGEHESVEESIAAMAEVLRHHGYAARLFDAIAHGPGSSGGAAGQWIEEEDLRVLAGPGEPLAFEEVSHGTLVVRRALGEGRLAIPLIVGEDIEVEQLFGPDGLVRADTLVLGSDLDVIERSSRDDRRQRRQQRQQQRQQRRQQRQQQRQQRRDRRRGTAPAPSPQQPGQTTGSPPPSQQRPGQTASPPPQQTPGPTTGSPPSQPSPTPGIRPERCTDADFVDPQSSCAWRLVLVPTVSTDAQNREFYASQIASVQQRIDAIQHPSPKGAFGQANDRYRFVPTFNTRGTTPAAVANKEFADSFFKPKISNSSATRTGLMGNDPMDDLTSAQRNTTRLDATFKIWRDVIIPSREGDTASINIAGGSRPGITLGSGLFQTATHDFLARLPPAVKKIYFEYGFAFEDRQIVALDTARRVIVSGGDAIKLIAGDQKRMAVFVIVAMSKREVEVPAAGGTTERIEARLAIARAMFKQIVALFGLFGATNLERLANLSDAEVRKFLVKIFFASTNTTVARAIESALTTGGTADTILDNAVKTLATKRFCERKGVSESQLLSTIGLRLSGTRETRAKKLVADTKKAPCT